MNARHLYHDAKNFDPTFKIWLGANHKPTVTDNSYAFWRRLRIIPFLARFDNGTCDKDLPTTLEAEYRGILAWMVRGCLLWQKEGLGEPLEVREATAQYRAESETFGPFFTECCKFDPNGWVATAEIQERYITWQTVNPESPAFDKSFWEQLKERGAFQERGYNKGHRVRGWQGVKLCDPVEPQAQRVRRGLSIRTLDLPEAPEAAEEYEAVLQ